MNTKKILLTLVVCMMLSAQSFATKHRVNSNTDINADFSSLQAAINSSTVNSGDTLYCEGGSYFGDITINKKVIIIGPGYFLSQNDSTQSYTAASTLNNLGFTKGSNGSKIMGMKILGSLQIGIINQDSVSNITVTRNHINSASDYSYSTIDEEYSNIRFINNYFTNQFIFSSETKSLYVYNNMFVGGYISLSPVTCDFENNVIVSDRSYSSALNASNCNITNNVIINTTTTNGTALSSNSYLYTSNNNIAHNLISDATESNYPSNYYSATVSATFVNAGSPDGKYKLASSSPAIGYGTNGDDCGAFGGSQPYALSGMPYLVPHIYEATVPGSVNKTDGLNIIIKAKAQNQ